jgi:dynein heavy chain
MNSTHEFNFIIKKKGMSTNFVVTINLPSEQDQDHWIRKGAALICSLND